MRAVGVFKALPIDHQEALVDLDLPVPVPGNMDLLVKVEAVAVNPADYRVRNRKVDDGQAAVLGWDVAGEVVEVGADVVGFAPGDSVYYAGDLTRPGANSEFHVVDARIVGQRPKTLDPGEAAAIPLTALTAWEALFDRLHFHTDGHKEDRTLLIVGGAGGAGSMAIQLARLVPDLRIIATASRPESRAWCEQLGADAVIDHFGDMAAQLTSLGHQTIDTILCLNDPDRHFPVLADIVTPQGSVCSIVPFSQPPDINRLMQKSATFAWELMFTRSMFRTTDMVRQQTILTQIADLIDTGRLITTLSDRLGAINATNLRAAHARLETGRTVGKLVLEGF